MFLIPKYKGWSGTSLREIEERRAWNTRCLQKSPPDDRRVTRVERTLAAVVRSTFLFSRGGFIVPYRGCRCSYRTPPLLMLLLSRRCVYCKGARTPHGIALMYCMLLSDFSPSPFDSLSFPSTSRLRNVFNPVNETERFCLLLPPFRSIFLLRFEDLRVWKVSGTFFKRIAVA